jgi:hypothetical protein
MINYYGLGTTAPDTLVIGIPENEERVKDVSHILRASTERSRNVVMIRLNPEQIDSSTHHKIVVWWGGKKRNASLMIALAYLLNDSHGWQKAQLCLQSITLREDQRIETKERLEEFSKRARIRAHCDVVVGSLDVPILSTIVEESKQADMVFLGLRPPDLDEDSGAYEEYLDKLFKATAHIPNLALVKAQDEVRLANLFS